MASLANAIDFFFGECVRPDSQLLAGKSSMPNVSGMKTMLAITYLVLSMFLVGMHDYSIVPGLPTFSFTCFMASALQFNAFATLYMRVKHNKTVAGISSQSLLLQAVSLLNKVVATTTHDGYLPADRTGDFLLQAMDCASLVAVSYLLYAIHKPYCHTYQSEHDTLPIGGICVVAFAAATCFHPDLNRCAILDTIWAFSLNVEVFQMAPQLYMLFKAGGADSSTAHYVGNQFFSCAFRLAFWVWAVDGCEELSSATGYGLHMEWGGIYIVGAFLLETLILMDFMYYYLKAMYKGGLRRDVSVSLPQGAIEL